MNSLIRSSFLAAFLFGCASAPARPVASPGATPPPAACPALLDARALLERHARAFGSREAVEASLPRSFAGEIVLEGKRGTLELVLERGGRYSSVNVIDGMPQGDGVDEAGPWALEYSGVPMRLRGDEAVDNAFDSWMNRRDYLDAFEPARDSSSCSVEAGAARVALRYRRADLGEPELVFDLADASLVRARAWSAAGTRVTRTYGAWAEPSPRGVRWPSQFRDEDVAGNAAVITLATDVPGLVCPSRPSEPCLAPPRAAVSFSWPGPSPVHVPMKFYQRQISLQTKIGGREFWALLDSGANLTALDVTTPLGRQFRPSLSLNGSGAGQLLTAGLGEMRDAVALGTLSADRLPVIAVPIPELENFGDRRPEIILGFSYFLAATIRIDYARGEVVLAQNGVALQSEKAVPVPMKLLGSFLAVEATLDGVPGLFELDTGGGVSLALYRHWAEPRGFPGPRPSLTYRARVGAGAGESDQTKMRPSTMAFGPVRIEKPLISMAATPFQSNKIAGILGNVALARCAAVVVDVPRRTLWLEPPCDRDAPENLAGWLLEKRLSAERRERPWVVKLVLPGSPADLAGVKPGDRLLEVGARPAVLDRAAFEPETEKPPGTAVPVTLERGGEERVTVLRLRRILEP